MTRARKVFVAVLLALAVAVYVAAKIDFFRHFNSQQIGGYLAGHSLYWLAMLLVIAALGVSIRQK